MNLHLALKSRGLHIVDQYALCHRWTLHNAQHAVNKITGVLRPIECLVKS